MNRIRILAAVIVGALFVGVIALALSVSMTGSGSLGQVNPGWSVIEECTPHVPGDTQGSVGSARFSAGATSTSRYLSENSVELTSDGTWLGVVSSVSEAGLNADVSAAGRLGFAVADATVDPVVFQNDNDLSFLAYGSGTGEVASPYDIAVDPVDGSIFVTSSGMVNGSDRYKVIKFSAAGAYVTEFGSFGTGNGQFGGSMHVAVAPDQSVWVSDGPNQRIQKFTRTSPTVYTYSTKVGSAGSGNGQFGSTSAIPIAVDSSGNVYAGDRGNSRVQKFNSSATYQAQGSVNSGTGAVSPWQVQVVGSTVYASDGLYVAAPKNPGHVTTFSTSLGAATGGVTLTAPDGTSTGIGYFSVNSDGTFWASWFLATYLVKYSATGTELQRWQSLFPQPVSLNDTLAVELSDDDYGYVLSRDIVSGFLAGDDPYGGDFVVGFDYRPVPLSDAIRGYLEACDPNLGGMNYSYIASSDPDVVFPGWTGNVWAKLKELGPLYGVEILPIGDTIVVRDIGSETLTLRNNTTVTTTPTVTAQGQKIIATIQQPTAGGGVMWDAYDDGSTYSIDVGQVKEVIVATDQHPVNLAFPVPTDTLPVQSGQYYVVDSTGTQVPAATWTAAGAKIEAQLIGPQQIQLKFFGPSAAISGYTGPFYFTSDRTASAYPTLTIGGNGVRVDRRTVTLYTPADPAIAQEVAFKFDSPFLDTLDRCYDRMTWAVDAASSPNVEIHFDIPVAQLGDFGQKLGALITHESSIYRVVRIERGLLMATVTARRYTTLANLDAAWSGQSNTTRDTFWSGYSSNDRQIQPLLTSR